MGKWADKVAIITGGGQGIGLGAGQCFAREGATLVITGRVEDKLKAAQAELEKLGAKNVVICVGDAAKRADAERAVKTAIDHFGRLDVLVNNAQSTTTDTPLEAITDDVIQMTVGSGLLGTLYHMQAAFPHMKTRGGSIINFGSREGIYGGVGKSVYAATKEGIRGLSRAAAREWGKYNIRVNVVCPAALSPTAEKYLNEHPEEANMYRKELSLGYFGDSEKDIGPIVLFLAGDESHYITGQTLNADGGQMML